MSKHDESVLTLNIYHNGTIYSTYKNKKIGRHIQICSPLVFKKEFYSNPIDVLPI